MSETKHQSPETQLSPHRVVIEPISGWQLVDWKDLVKRRDLLYFLVWRDIKARYAQSIFGIGWAIINPIVQMLIYTVIFGVLTQIPSDGVPYPIFSYTALVPWTYFSSAITRASNSTVNSIHLMGKVYFPRLFLPLAAVVDAFVDFLIALVILFFMMLLFQVEPTASIVFLPLLIAIMVLAALGIGLMLSAFAVQYRDIAYAMGAAVRLLMYFSPVIYSANIVPGQFRLIYALNPMVGVIEGFRSALLGTNPMPWGFIGIGATSTFLFLVVGLLYFRRREHLFADIA